MAHPLDEAISHCQRKAVATGGDDFWVRLEGSLRKARSIDDWRDMESAPRDGRLITVMGRRDLAHKKAREFDCRYDLEFNVFIDDKGYQISCERWKPFLCVEVSYEEGR